MEEVVSAVDELQLDNIDDVWVEAAICSEYLEYEEISTDHDAACFLNESFISIMEALNSWLSMETDNDEEKTWATLATHILYRKLLAVLGYCIHSGSKDVMEEELRTRALLSARLYFKLLSVPGFTAYDIYHPQLFALSLACIGFPKIICEKFDEETKHDNKIEKKAKIQEHRMQANLLIKQLQLFAVDLRAIIEQLQLAPNDMNFEDILNNLVEVIGGSIVNKLNIDRIELSNLTKVVYEVIHVLVCDANEKPNSLAISSLFKCLHEKLLSVCLDPRPSNSIVRASYVSYSGVLLTKYGKVALENFHILLEHLCYNAEGLERSETRTARVQMVSGLMSFLPEKVHSKLMKWIIILSKSSKMGHRLIAVDILETMLSYQDSGTRQSNETSVSNEQRVEAENTNEMVQNSEENTETSATTMNVNETAQEAAPVNPEPEVTEEDLQEILHQRTITVPYRDILHAMYERVNDASGTVRNRAVVVLTKCIDSQDPAMKQALKEMHEDGEGSRLMAVAARCVCDERAAVRRSAVTLVLRLLLTQFETPSNIDLSILVGMCRDTSVVVRSAAIQAIGELVVNRPTTPVFDAFLLGPMRQLADPDVKVQDAIKNQLQNLLITRVKKFSLADEDPIPWMLLAGIVKHNMRRHLQKACSLLANSAASCISVRLVDCLSTHLGELGYARDLQTLVMLTSVARHVEYSDISFALQYYYHLVDEHQNGVQQSDQHLMPLILDLLSMWSRFARPDERIALREHLVAHLAAPSDDGCRIARAFLAVQLDTSNIDWASELMQLAEQSALEGNDVEEWLRAADLSLVATKPPMPGLLQLFLHKIKNPPAEWEPREAGECVAGAGRLCLRSRAAAAAAAPALAALLHARAPMQARINALLVLADIASRYANIVDSLLGHINRCLDRQTPPELRRQAVRTITQLLLAEYLRMSTPLYYKFYALLADEDHVIREPVEYYVTSVLQPKVIASHFIDSIVYYNSDASENISFESRQFIYDMMLQRLTNTQKNATLCQIAETVLQKSANTVEDGDELPLSTKSVLVDTIAVLCGPRMRLPPKKHSAATSNDADESQERVTNNSVSENTKTTVSCVMIPAVLRLHAALRSEGGELITYLVRLATDLLNDYNAEVEDRIMSDETLSDQIKQFQEMIGAEPVNGNVRNLATSSSQSDPETPRHRSAASSSRTHQRRRILRT